MSPQLGFQRAEKMATTLAVFVSVGDGGGGKRRPVKGDEGAGKIITDPCFSVKDSLDLNSITLGYSLVSANQRKKPYNPSFPAHLGEGLPVQKRSSGGFG